MNLDTKPQKYDPISMLFHWMMGGAIIALLVIGWLMGNMPALGKFWWYGLHKSIGFLILILLPVRLYWRSINVTPENTSVPLLRCAARLNVVLLYILMFTMALSGFVMSDAGGHGINLFNVLPVPLLFAKNPDMAKISHTIHVWAPFALAGLIGLHVFAAMYHHFVKRDHTLTSMLPR